MTRHPIDHRFDFTACFAPDYAGRRALREDHWLHAFAKVDWADAQTQRIKRQLRKQYYPDSDDWREMVLSRSRQVIRQALAGLAAA